MFKLTSKIARQFSDAFPRSFETVFVPSRRFAGPGRQSCLGQQQIQAYTVSATARTVMPLVGSKLNANASCFAESTYICRSYSSDKEVEKTTPASESAKGTTLSSEAVSSTGRKRPPTNFERKIFVWTGKFKTANEVPDQVSEASLNAAKNKFRIYVNVGMGVATFIAAIGMVIIGKSRAKRGESVSKINIRRHPETYSKLIESQNSK